MADRQGKPEKDRKFKKEIIITAVVVFLITLSTLVEVRMTSFRHLSISSRVIIYAYINVSIILFLVMLFLLSRNIIKLIIDRKMKVVGSRLRTRLVLLFVVVSLVPSLFVLIVIILSGFFSNIINKWYHPRIQKAMEYSMQIVRPYHKYISPGSPTGQKLAWLTNFLNEYSQIRFIKNPVETTYLIFFSIFTILILFVSSWIGFYLSKKLTAPIIDLVEGTKKIASGKLNIDIPVNSEDEIGMLVNSFNEMAKDLYKNEQLIEKANNDLKLVNEETDKRRKYMEIILKNIYSGVIAMDSSGKIRSINNAVEEMFGIKAPDVMNRHYREVFDKSSFADIRSIIKEMAKENREAVTKEIRLNIKGILKVYIVNLTVLKDELNNNVGFIIVLNDTTDVMKAQRVAAWEEVAKRMAHEIKNPLTPIKLSAERLKRKFGGKMGAGGDTVFSESIDTIIKEVDDLKSIVDEFSLYARLPKANFENADINALLEGVMPLYENAHRDVEFQTFYAGGLGQVFIDRQQIKRAFVNILENAIYSISLKNAGNKEPGFKGRIKVVTGNSADDNFITIKFSDNGEGLTEESLQNMYEPYFSTKQGGTGLGLAITKNIMLENNAEIEAFNNAEGGADFIITIKK